MAPGRCMWPSVAAALALLEAARAQTFGIDPAWPGGAAMRGTRVTTSNAQEYTLLGVGYCRGGPPGGTIATNMVSYIRKSGSGAPNSSACFEICDMLQRCTGVELRNSDDWCELQIPSLSRTGSGTVSSQTDWGTGFDAAAETTYASGYDANAVANSPAALTMARPLSGFYCWGKVMDCTGLAPETCDAVGRYPCQESYRDQSCGPCLPLHVAVDSSDARLPGPTSSPCVPDLSASLPTLKVSLASPWFGGRKHEEALYLAMIYGAKKAWADRASTDLIPIPLGKRMPFGFNVTGHTDEWGYTLSAQQLSTYGVGDSSWDTRIENHPMAGVRAMAALKQDDYTTQYGLLEPEDLGRTRPHCIIGSTSDNSNSGVYKHSILDKPISHVATFFEVPVLGWSFGDKEFADKTNHAYYLRVNPVGLDFHLALSKLIQEWQYTRVAVVTSGTSRAFVRGLQDRLGQSVELLVEDMNLQNPCQDVTFSKACHTKLISSLERLRGLDARVIIHEQDGMTQLDSYWAVMLSPQLYRHDTLSIQIGALGDCKTPLIPPTDGSYGLRMLWENIRIASNGNNRGEWDQMPGDCRVCPNWAFRDVGGAALNNWQYVAEYNFNRTETVYGWSSFCPELPTLQDILACTWCNATADFWITPACTDELQRMREQLKGTLCVGVEDKSNATRINAWADYLSGLTAAELVAAGAPQSFFDVFEAPHPLFAESGVTLASKWSSSWRMALKEKAALLDSLLLSLTAFNEWVKAAGDSTPSLSATALRVGFRTVHNAPIPNWLAVLVGTEFDGLTGRVRFNSQSERISDYMIYSAQGPNLAFDPVARYDIDSDRIDFFAPVYFNDGTQLRVGNASSVPPDREPPCSSGEFYNMSARGCIPCPAGYYCVGGRIAAIECSTDPGTVAPNQSMSSCVQCPAGSTPNNAFTGCSVCPEGSHAVKVGSLDCMPCDRGSYWEAVAVPAAFVPRMLPGQFEVSSCQSCPIGKYQDQTGQTECKSCTGGRRTFGARAVSAGDCLCPEDTYLPLGGDACVPCVIGMECKLGSDMANYQAAANVTAASAAGTGEYPKLRPRYWSAVDAPLDVFLCRSEAACPGGTPKPCAGQAEGLMCAQCAPGFYDGGETCMECNSLELSKALFPIIPCVAGPMIILVLYVLGRTPVSRWSAPKQGIVICGVIVLMHFQVMGLLWQCNLFFPKTLGNTWGRFNQINKGLSLLRIRCAGIDLFSERYYVNVAWPLLLVCIFIITFLISRAVNFLFRKKADSAIVKVLVHRVDRDCLVSTYGSLYEALFIGIAVQSLTLFHCYEHPNGKESLHVAPEILCDSTERKDMMVIGILALILYIAGFCAILSWVLLVAPRRFQQAPFQRRWKFILAKYRPDVWWWSAAVLTRSLALSMSVVILKDGAHQLVWVATVLVAYGYTAYAMKPWRHLYASRLDYLVCYLLTLAACSMLHFAANPSDPDKVSSLGKGITIFVQSLSFFPCALAFIGMCHLAYRHFRPGADMLWMESTLLDLRRVGSAMNKMDLNSEHTRLMMNVLSDRDWEVLRDAVDLLVVETHTAVQLAAKPRLCSSSLNLSAEDSSQLAFMDKGAKSEESPRSLPDEDYQKYKVAANGKVQPTAQHKATSPPCKS